jgi:steroid 5-alpha reductase family enzyme
MKENTRYTIRRAVVGLIAIPAIAAAYTLGYVLMVGLNVPATDTLDGVWSTGFLVAAVLAVVFTFISQVKTAIDKILDIDETVGQEQ